MKITTEKLKNAIKLSFPVIQFNTGEATRVEKVIENTIKEYSIKKSLISMPFKALPNENTIKSLIDKVKNKSKYNGFIIHDSYFFERMEVNKETLPALRSALSYLESNGVNYIISGKSYLKEEFVYILELHSITEKEMDEVFDIVSKSFEGKNITFTKEEKEKIFNYARGLSYMQIKNLFMMSFYLKYQNKEYIDELKKEKKALLQEYGLEILDPVSIDEIGGLENLKEWIKIRQVGWNKNLPLKGVLLRGVQGTGKTLAAKAIASILNTPLVALNVQNFYNRYVGETEHRFRQALKVIDDIAPATVLIDEIEKVFGTNSSDSNGITQRLLGTFLNWLQERKSKVFLVGTANNEMPPELTRTGRWDKQFFVDLPNKAERKAIFQVHLKKNNIPNSVITNWDKLLELTNGYTGAEIAQAVLDAKYIASYEEREVKEDDLITAITMITPIFKTNKKEIEVIRSLKYKGFYPASKGDSFDEENNNENFRRIED